MKLASEQMIKEYTDNGWWGTETIYDLFRNLVESKPDMKALSDPLNREQICGERPKTFTYYQLNEAVERAAAILVKHGIKKDDIVAIQLPNVAEIVISYLALLRIDAIVTPFPVQYREHEYNTLLNFVEAKAVITMTNILKHEAAQSFVNIKGNIPSIEKVFAWGEYAPEGTVSMLQENLSANDSDRFKQEVEYSVSTANDIFTICWTSGTEGKPKGVPRSHNEWIISSYATIDVADLTEKDILLNTFPMVNMAGIAGVFVPWLLTGSQVIMHHPFDLPTFLQQIEVEKATYTLAPPALLNRMLDDDRITDQVDFTTLRAIGSGSTPLMPRMVKGWNDKFNIDIINLFGSNEGATYMSGPKDIPDPEQRATYFPRFGVEPFKWSTRIANRFQSKLVNPKTGEEITEPGKPGEMRIKGSSILQGYWNRKDINEKAFDKDGYFCSGDMFEIAVVDGQPKFYKFVGRMKEIIIRGGMNISPSEIEDFLHGHPKISETGVIGVPDKTMGERACACIVLSNPNETIDLKELIAHFKEAGFAMYKIPESIYLTNEIPRNPVGKILKSQLREQVLGEKPITN